MMRPWEETSKEEGWVSDLLAPPRMRRPSVAMIQLAVGNEEG